MVSSDQAVVDPIVTGVDVKGQTKPSVARVPRTVKIAYGMAEASSSVAFTAFAVFYLIFLTDVAGIDPGTASLVLALAVVWDAFSDPLMGVISDHTKSRFGRRRPYLLGVAVPFGITFWLSFSVPSLEGPMLVAYFVLVSLAMHTAITVFAVPYTALLPEMTGDYDERSSIVSYRVLWAQLGALMGASLPILIASYFSDPVNGWSAAGAILGFFCIFPILITWRATRGRESGRKVESPLGVGEVYTTITRNRTFRFLIVTFLFAITATTATGAVSVYFLRYCLEFTESQVSIYFVVFFASSLLWVPVVEFFSVRIGKPLTFAIFVGVGGLFIAITTLLIAPGQFELSLIIGSISSVVQVTVYQMIWSMVPDVVEVEEFNTGKRNEGLYFGVTMFINKLGSATAVFMVGQYLSWVGYQPNGAQTPEVLMGLRVLMGPIAASLLGVAVLTALFIPMTRQRHRALVKAIKAKQKGENWDDREFKALL